MRNATARRIRLVVNAFLLTVAVLLTWIATQQQREPFPPGLTPGTKFPPLALVGADGDTVSIDLAAGTGEKLIVFYSSTCVFCQRSLPVYWSLSKKCDPSLILAVTDLTGSAMVAWWEETMDGFADGCESMTMGSVAGSLSSYQLRGTPTHYLIGRDGRVKHHSVGSLSEIPSWLN